MCRSKELITKAINENDFLRNLGSLQISEIVDCMFRREFTKEQFICREGSVGTELYVISGQSATSRRLLYPEHCGQPKI